jgi:hypothetical protein
MMDYEIKFRPIKPASPHLNGKVERSQKTDMDEFYATVDLQIPELGDRVAARQHNVRTALSMAKHRWIGNRARQRIWKIRRKRRQYTRRRRPLASAVVRPQPQKSDRQISAVYVIDRYRGDPYGQITSGAAMLCSPKPV